MDQESAINVYTFIQCSISQRVIGLFCNRLISDTKWNNKKLTCNYEMKRLMKIDIITVLLSWKHY